MNNALVKLSINRKEISFREAYKLPSTTFGAFGIFNYPAKFIPNVVLYIMSNYLKNGNSVIDPFAGYGTVGFAGKITGNPYILWDLNPILDVIHSAVEVSLSKCIEESLIDKVLSIFRDASKSNDAFLPNWSNIRYWFPDEFLDFLSRIWYKAHSLEIPEKPIILLALLKTTRFFSFSDEKVYKLYKSKKAKEKVSKLLRTNWQATFFEILKDNLYKIIHKLIEYKTLAPKNVAYEIEVGVDTLRKSPQKEVDALITSPPYLQAQEYIRSVKLELYWLGYSEEFIKELSKKEIPYRKDIPSVEIKSDIYEYLKSLIKEEHLLDTYEKYFKAIIYAFENISHYIRQYMFIFVGHVHLGDIKIPIDDIIVEHFLNTGDWKHEITYIDKVKCRSMFNTKNGINPASGRINTRMETEHLIVLKRS